MSSDSSSAGRVRVFVGGGNDRSDSSNRSGTDHRGGGPGWGK
jgi:hypothetical protein